MSIITYICDFNKLDISDFIKKYYSSMRRKIFTDMNYVNYVCKHFSKVHNLIKYVYKPIFYKAYNDIDKDDASYNLAVKRQMAKLLSKYLDNKNQIKTDKITLVHSQFITDSNSYNDLLNIEKALIKN